VSGSVRLSLFSGWTVFRFGGGARRKNRRGGSSLRSVFAGLGMALFGQGTGGGGGSSAGRSAAGSRAGGRATGSGSRSGAGSFERFAASRPDLFTDAEDQDGGETAGADAGAGGED
jgi:hypothetical protein